LTELLNESFELRVNGEIQFVNPKRIDTLMLGTVAHTCNPPYSGGKDWEDPGLRPSRKIIHKNLHLRQ
jgi:hypothetical protein